MSDETKRDELAKSVLQVLLAWHLDGARSVSDLDFEVTAGRCYAMADAMLSAREAKP